MTTEGAHFAQLFVENVRRRSRTANGELDTTASPLKDVRATTGQPLAVHIESNALAAASLVWDLRERTLSHAEIRELSQALHRTLTAGTEVIGGNNGYRTWPLAYSWWPPDEIEPALQWFYRRLAHFAEWATAEASRQAQLLAFADYMLDAEIHPWADGCGRVATGLVMWLSVLTPAFAIPTFGRREEHYRSFRSHSLCEHVDYMVTCLSRDGSSEVRTRLR